MICDIVYGILCVAQGHGAKGQNEYEFSLEFNLPVKSEVCIHLKTYPSYFLLLLSCLCLLVLLIVIIT